MYTHIHTRVHTSKKKFNELLKERPNERPNRKSVLTRQRQENWAFKCVCNLPLGD